MPADPDTDSFRPALGRWSRGRGWPTSPERERRRIKPARRRSRSGLVGSTLTTIVARESEIAERARARLAEPKK
jgi:hypothetical protein